MDSNPAPSNFKERELTQTPSKPKISSMLGILAACWLSIGYLFLIFLTDAHLTWGNFETARPDLATYLPEPEQQPEVLESVEVLPRTAPTQPAKQAVLAQSQADTIRRRIPKVPEPYYPAVSTAIMPDTGTPRILLMGDSMAESLYFALKYMCKWSNFYLKMVAVKGTSSFYWAENDTLAYAIREFKPTLILFSLGANEVTIPNLKARKRLFKRVLHRFDTLPYIWVGTPVWTADTVYGHMMREMVPANQLFISQGIAMSRKADGAHPDIPGSKIWADSLARWMMAHSRYPLPWQLTEPANFTNKLVKTSVFFNQPPAPKPKTVLAAAPAQAPAQLPNPTPKATPAAAKPAVVAPPAPKPANSSPAIRKPAPARKPTNVDSLDASYNR